MNEFACCVLLMIFGAGLQAEFTAERTFVPELTQYKILNDQEELNDDYKVLLSEFAKNCFTGNKIHTVLSSSDCSICNRVLGVLMNASAQSFVTINDIPSTNDSIDAIATEVIRNIGYYKFIIFLIDNASEFFQHFDKLRLMDAWNPRAQHLIFTAKKQDDEELEMIFKESWSHKVLNVAVIIYNQKEAYTYNPYLKNQSEMREKVQDWSKLFYDKLRNVNGHSIRTRYIPFSTSIAKWIKEEARFKFFGEDFGFAEAFFKSVNATPGFIDLTVDRVPCYRNFTYRQKIWNERKFDDTELWMNFIPVQIKIADRFERTYPLRTDNLRILVPKSGSKPPSIFEPYDDITWICVALSLITFALYSRVLFKWRGIDDNACLRTLGIFLGKNLAKRRHGVLEKFTFVVFTMGSLLILSTYQGALYRALTTVPQYPEINTMSELYKRIKTIYTYQAIADYFKYVVQPGTSVLAFNTQDFFQYMKTHRDVAYAFPHTVAEHNAKLKILSENGVPFYHVMNEYALPSFVTHILPYGSPYLEKLEKVLLVCREAGLAQYWKAEDDFEAILSGTIISNVPEGRTLKKLSLHTQLTAFYIWGIGLLVSFFCFAAEIYLHKNKKKISMIQ